MYLLTSKIFEYILLNILVYIEQTDKKFQELAWMHIVTNLITQEQKEELLKTFKALDSNCDGRISRDELIRGFNSI